MLGLLGLVISLQSCAKTEAHGPELRVFAAASLTESFAALATAFEAEQAGATPSVRVHTAGTPQLVLQLREGARADVFASADRASMTQLLAILHDGMEADSVPRKSKPHNFASNQLAILVAHDNPHDIAQLADLSRPALRFAMAGPQVPAGRYAREALALAGVQAGSRSDEASVRGVLQKVLFGELDAGLVYRSDLHQLDPALSFVSIPAAHQPRIDYPIVALPQAAHPKLAAAFVDFVLSEPGQAILRAHGFGAAR